MNFSRNLLVLFPRMRERRVLIQMCILVVAFVVCWFPFWILVTALHICMPDCLSPHINTVGTAFQVLFYAQ